MADDIKVVPSAGAGDPAVATDEVGGRHYQWVKPAYGGDGVATPVDETNRLPVATGLSQPLTDAQMRASSVPVEDGAAGNFLQRILQMLLAPLGYDKSLQRYRGTAIIESGTVTTVTTVTTVAGLTNINGRNGDMLVNAQVNACWALNVRARIT